MQRWPCSIICTCSTWNRFWLCQQSKEFIGNMWYFWKCCETLHCALFVAVLDCRKLIRFILGNIAAFQKLLDCFKRTGSIWNFLKGEISKILELKVPQSRIIYANPCKQASHIKYAAKHGVKLMTFDNETELRKVKELHPKAKLVNKIY